VDTLRADAVGYSGAPGAAATPVLDALARESAVFTRCRAPCSWTKPSTASLLTGLYPSQHGAVDFESLLPGEAVTLAEVLRAAGWRTAAFSDNPFVSPEFGFGQGFESFSGRHPSPLARGTLLLQAFAQVRLRIAGGAAFSFGPGVDLGADRILGDGVDFLLRQGDARPAFAYCHLIEPHYPYTPPPPFDGGRPRVDPPHSSGILPFDSFPDVPAAEAATMRANYLGEVSAADAAIGRAVERLRKAGTLDRTLLVVTSDHGEEFHEHGGWTHGQSLYEELVRVPLLLRGPGVPAGRTCNGLASLVDVAPTILELARVVSDGSMAPSRHWTLRGPLGGEETDFTSSFVLAELESGPVGARAIFMPVPGSGPVGGPDHDLACMESWKGGERRTEAFDLDGDAGVGRERPVADSDTSRVLRDFMEREFARLRREALRRVVRPVDPDTRRALEGLGYGK